MFGVRILLEKLGIRCGECGNLEFKVNEERKLEYGTNAGNMLLMNPFYLVTRIRKCANCSHVANSKLVRTEIA